MLGMLISRENLTFRILGSRSRSLWLFSEKRKRSSAYIYWWILILRHTNVGYDNISSKFDFQGPGLKVKVIVTVAIFRKKKNIALEPTFIDGYNFTQMFGMIISRASLRSCAEGQGHCGYF